MPITIREILASDTISGAADKINFNFDQLLLNGGGPPGPAGPQGPIGPIGGRGIRGSVWYEGLSDPNTAPPTLTPEDEDNYLQANGAVWTYSSSAITWINTTINLTGPVGPAGASGKFSEYDAPAYVLAGDTTIYPTAMSFSGNSVNNSVKSVIIGGLPSGLGNPNTGNEIIAQSLATAITQPAVSLLVHQFDSSGGGIKFHGGNTIIDNFTNILTELAEIRLLQDDRLYINVPKTATLPSGTGDVDGLVVTTSHRGQLYQSGKRIQFQTGVSALSYSFGDTNDFIVDAARSGTGSFPTIQLNVLGTTGAPTAAFRLGDTGTSALPVQTGDARLGAGLITINGNTSITATSPLITLSGTQQTNIYAGTTLPVGATGQVTIGASSQIVMRTINGASTGAITISTGNSTTGSVSLLTGTTSSGNIAISTSLGTGRVNISSGAINSGGLGAINLVTDSSSAGAILLATGISSTGDILVSTSLGTGRVNITSSAINSGGLGAINLITDSSSTGAILLATGSSSTGNIIISTVAGSGDVAILADTDVLISHGVSDSVTIQPIGGSSNANVNVKPLGTATQSNINVWGDSAATTTNLQLRSDSSTNEGSMTVANGMDLRLVNDGLGPDHIRVIAGDAAPTAGSDDPRFAVNAANHYVNHPSRITPAPTGINIIASGRFVSTTTTSGRDLQLNWMRVGDVVNCTGVILAGSALGASEVVLLPIGTALSNSVRGVWSTTSLSGTVNDSGGTSANFQTPTGVTTSVFFSFSYVIG